MIFVFTYVFARLLDNHDIQRLPKIYFAIYSGMVSWGGGGQGPPPPNPPNMLLVKKTIKSNVHAEIDLVINVEIMYLLPFFTHSYDQKGQKSSFNDKKLSECDKKK